LDRCALFVDANYALAEGALTVHGTRNRDSVSWDYAGLLRLLGSLSRDRTGLPLLRCYWYDTAADGARAAEHEALGDIPGLKLRLSKARPSRREGVEAEIRKDLTALARNHAISDVVIVSAEEDLAPVIAEVQDLGVRTVLLHVAIDGDWAMSRTLRQECDDLIEIGSGHLRPYVDLISGAEPQLPAPSVRELTGTAAQSSGPQSAIEAPTARLYGSPLTADYEHAALAAAGQGQAQRQDALRFGGLGEMLNSGPIGGSGDIQPQPQMPGGRHMQSDAAQPSVVQSGHGQQGHGQSGHGQSGHGQQEQHYQDQRLQDQRLQEQGQQSQAQSAQAQHYQQADAFDQRVRVDDGRGQPGSLGDPGSQPPNGAGQNGPGHSQLGHSQLGHSQQSQNGRGRSQQSQSQFGQAQFGQAQFGQAQFGQPQFGQGQPGQGEPGQGEPGQGEPGQGQFGQLQPGQNGQSGVPGLGSNGAGGQHAGGFGSHSADQQGSGGSQPAGQPGNGLQPGGMPSNGMRSNGMPSGPGGPVGGQVSGPQAGGYQSQGLPQAGTPLGGLPANGPAGQGMPANGMSSGQGGMPRPGGSNQDGNGQSASGPGQSLPGLAPNGGQYQQGGQPAVGPPMQSGQQGPRQLGRQNQGGALGQPGYGQSGLGQAGLSQAGAGLQQRSGGQGGPAVPPATLQPSTPPPTGLPPSAIAPNRMVSADSQRPPTPQRQLPSGNGGPYAHQDRSMPYGGSAQPAQFSAPASTSGYGPSSYGGQQQAMAPVAMPVGDAVQSAHAEGFGFGEAVARDAPALWLEAVLARKPRMPSDLEARLLQGSALPIDSLLHDEVRHALRRGFWDALERSRH
jgi:hypothetical protein